MHRGKMRGHLFGMFTLTDLAADSITKLENNFFITKVMKGYLP